MSGDWVTRKCPDCGDVISADVRDIEAEMRRHRAWCNPK